jgi:AraC-like DNA-binding protein
VLPTILFVTVDWPAGIVFSLTVERFARIIPVSSAIEAVRRLAERSFGLVILEQSCHDTDLRALVDAAKARRCSVLVLGETERCPMLIQGLVEVAASALAGHVRRSSELRQLSRRVSQAIERIRGNYHEPLTVRAIADAIHVSSSHLAHRFRLETGMSVKAYLTRVRVEMARRMLMETDAKLESIASAVGFCDAPHLSRVFVQYTRRRPGEYRRRPLKQAPTSAVQNRPLSSS